MEISNPSCKMKEVTSCRVPVVFGWCAWSKSDWIEDRCGADGFAVVL